MRIKLYLVFLLALFSLPLPVLASDIDNGIALFNSGNYIQAETYFKKTLYYQPKNLTARYYYASSLFNNRKFDKAKTEYSYIITNNPNTEAAFKSIQALNYINNLANYKNSIKKAEIDITNNHNILVVNDVIFNDSLNVSLILDTGASNTVISRHMADMLGLNLKNAQMVKLNTANGTVLAPKVTVKSIEINGLTAQNVDVVIQDIGSNNGMSGLLGLSFLNRFKVTIDKKAGKLLLEKN